MGDSRAGNILLSEKLRQIADSKNKPKISEDVYFIVTEAIDAATKAAEQGVYSVEIYNSKLFDKDIAKAVKEQLLQHKFKVNIFYDKDYSDHANQDMVCLNLKW